MTSKGNISPEEEKKLFEQFGITDASKVFPGLTDKTYVDPLDKAVSDRNKELNPKKGGKRRSNKRRTNKKRTNKRRTNRRRSNKRRRN
jgi:hypothetical protein